MLKASDISGLEQLLLFSLVLFLLLLTTINDLSSYPVDIPRLYSFKDAKYMLTPLQNFLAHAIVFLLFFVPTIFTICKKCLARLKAEEKSLKHEFLLLVKEAKKSFFVLLLYSVIFFGTLAILVGGIFWILFKIFMS